MIDSGTTRADRPDARRASRSSTCRRRGRGRARCASSPTGTGGRTCSRRRGCSGRSARPRRGTARIIWLVADVAALADVDVAARELERRVGPHALDALDRDLDGEQRRRSRPARRSTTVISDAGRRAGRAALLDGRVLAPASSSALTPPARPRRSGRRASAPPRADSPRSGAPHVEGHQQRAGDVEDAAERPDDVERVHRGDGLDEPMACCSR